MLYFTSSIIIFKLFFVFKLYKDVYIIKTKYSNKSGPEFIPSAKQNFQGQLKTAALYLELPPQWKFDFISHTKTQHWRSIRVTADSCFSVLGLHTHKKKGGEEVSGNLQNSN